MEAGAEDITSEEGMWEVTGAPSDFIALKEAIDAAGIVVSSAEVTMVPDTMVSCDVDGGQKVLRMLDAIEGSDDVQKVYTNADIPEEAMEG